MVKMKTSKPKVFIRYKHRGQPFYFVYSTVAAKVSDRVLPGDFDIRVVAKQVGIPLDDGTLGDRSNHTIVLDRAIELGIPFHISPVFSEKENKDMREVQSWMLTNEELEDEDF